ncbi:uncharacterized protein [Leptinotarsa decemlineata]|uniref:uncharacterized protein n=1 Tax=Leptinotarsa decemlineata TaxID=7539 RepID=UPI003D30753E
MYPIKRDQPFYSSLRTLRFFLVYREYSQEPWQILISLIKNIGEDISEDLSFIVGGLGMMITNILFKFHRKKWSRLFEDVTNIDTFGKPANFDKVKSQCIFLSKLYTIYCIIGTIVYTCISVLESSCEDPNEGIERKSICGTISPIWLPVENVSTATRNLILLIQYILGNYMVIPPAIITFLVFETTELLICHIGFLKENILESLQCEKEELESNRLRFCITYHNHILRRTVEELL